MDKPADRLTREKQFRVRVPIGAIFITTHVLMPWASDDWNLLNNKGQKLGL